MDAALSPDGKLVAACHFGGTRIWDTRTGQEVQKFPVGEKEASPYRVAFSPEGVLLATAADGVRLRDVQTGRLVRLLPDAVERRAPCDAVAFSDDGTQLAVGSQERIVRVWDVSRSTEGRQAGGKELLALGKHAKNITGVAFSRDGRRLASTSGGLDRDAPPPGLPNPLNLPSDSQDEIPDLKVWDLSTSTEGQQAGSTEGRQAGGKEVLSLRLPDKVMMALALSPDGELVAVSFKDSSIRLYDTATGREASVLRGHTYPAQGLAFSPDGERLASNGGGDQTVRLWHPRTGEEILTLGRLSAIGKSVAFSRDGQQIVAASLGGEVRVWDATWPRK
jgi:WD40 repeat protein